VPQLGRAFIPAGNQPFLAQPFSSRSATFAFPQCDPGSRSRGAPSRGAKSITLSHLFKVGPNNLRWNEIGPANLPGVPLCASADVRRRYPRDHRSRLLLHGMQVALLSSHQGGIDRDALSGAGLNSNCISGAILEEIAMNAKGQAGKSVGRSNAPSSGLIPVACCRRHAIHCRRRLIHCPQASDPRSRARRARRLALAPSLVFVPASSYSPQSAGYASASH